MASVTINDETAALGRDLVSRGLFDTLEEAVEAGVRRLGASGSQEATALEDLPPHVRAAVERGIADMKAGRVKDGDEVFSRLLKKYKVAARAA